MATLVWSGRGDYNGGNMECRLVTLNALTVNGTATMYATSDGTATGPALFTTILHANACALGTTQAFCAIQSISSDLKTIKVSSLGPTGILLGGLSMAIVANNTTIQLMLIGI